MKAFLGVDQGRMDTCQLLAALKSRRSIPDLGGLLKFFWWVYFRRCGFDAKTTRWSESEDRVNGFPPIKSVFFSLVHIGSGTGG